MIIKNLQQKTVDIKTEIVNRYKTREQIDLEKTCKPKVEKQPPMIQSKSLLLKYLPQVRRKKPEGRNKRRLNKKERDINNPVSL